MANPTFDAVTTNVGQATTFTFNHTIGAGANFLEVKISFRQSVTVNSVTYDTVAMTQSGTVTNGHTAEHWKLANPATGLNEVKVTFSGDAEAVIAAISYNDVGSVGTFASATGSGSPATVDVSSASDELVSDVGASFNSSRNWTVGASQTQRYNTNKSGAVRGVGSEEVGSATTTMSWSLDFSGAWAIGAVALEPVVVTGPPTGTLAMMGYGK